MNIVAQLNLSYEISISCQCYLGMDFLLRS